MKSPTPLIFIYLSFIILGIKEINGIDPPRMEGRVHMNKATTSIVIVGRGRNSTGNSIIRLPFAFSNKSYENYTLFRYRVSVVNVHILRHPNNLKSIIFNNKTLEFEDSVILPCGESWSLDIFACKNNYPLLIRIFGQYGYSIYTEYQTTSKWASHKILSLNEYEYIDENGSRSYKYKNEEEMTLIHNNTLRECSFLADNLCEKTECRAKEVDLLSIELRLKLNDLGNLIGDITNDSENSREEDDEAGNETITDVILVSEVRNNVPNVPSNIEFIEVYGNSDNEDEQYYTRDNEFDEDWRDEEEDFEEEDDETDDWGDDEDVIIPISEGPGEENDKIDKILNELDEMVTVEEFTEE